MLKNISHRPFRYCGGSAKSHKANGPARHTKRLVGFWVKDRWTRGREGTGRQSLAEWRVRHPLLQKDTMVLKKSRDSHSARLDAGPGINIAL